MGLYDDDKAELAGGDILDVIYWQTKFAFTKFKAALASKQPEGDIRFTLIDVVSGCEDLLKTYPKHAELQSWLAEAKKIQAKVNPESMPQGWRGDFEAWGQNSYEMAWRAAPIARMAMAIEDYDQAASFGRDAVTYLTQARERMSTWSADAKTFVETTLPEMEQLVEKIKGRS